MKTEKKNRQNKKEEMLRRRAAREHGTMQTPDWKRGFADVVVERVMSGKTARRRARCV